MSDLEFDFMAMYLETANKDCRVETAVFALAQHGLLDGVAVIEKTSS